MATCIVSGTLVDLSETAINNATIKATLITPYFDSTNFIVPKELSTTTDSNGDFSLTLIQGASVLISLEYPPNAVDTPKKMSYNILIPALPTADISTLITEL